VNAYRELLRTLVDGGVEFVVVGGFAATVQPALLKAPASSSPQRVPPIDHNRDRSRHWLSGNTDEPTLAVRCRIQARPARTRRSIGQP